MLDAIDDCFPDVADVWRFGLGVLLEELCELVFDCLVGVVFDGPHPVDGLEFGVGGVVVGMGDGEQDAVGVDFELGEEPVVQGFAVFGGVVVFVVADGDAVGFGLFFQQVGFVLGSDGGWGCYLRAGVDCVLDLGEDGGLEQTVQVLWG
jgi:hypothetical protein